MSNGKILGIDYGTKRIGIAVSDESRQVAFGRKFIKNKSKQYVISELKELCEEEKVVEIVVGYPLNMEGDHTATTNMVDNFIKLLENEFETPIITHDERLTSKQGDVILSSLGKKGDAKKNESDIIAATIILQNYLDLIGKIKGEKRGIT